MKYAIYKSDCPVLVLTAITESGYSLNTDESRALTFATDDEAKEVTKHIPGTTSNFWGTRPHRPKNP